MDIGAKLRQAREARGISIASLSAVTRLAPRWLETIERNDPSVFPPGPYARGYVRAYAREVGLDPDETAREYFAQFQPLREAATTADTNVPRIHLAMEAPPARSFAGPALVALCVVVAVVAWNWRGDGRGTQEAGAVGTSGQVEAPAVVPSSPAPPPAVREDEEPLTVTLTGEQPSWITATADGKRVLFRLLAKGERETVRGDRQLTIRAGNAGGVRWSVGRRDLGPMGTSGEVRTVVVTPENAKTVR